MSERESERPGWVLAGACAGLFVLMLDGTVVNLALPELRRELGASTAELQWIPNVYLLTIAALVVTAGRLGDLVGRRRVFVLGMAVFAAGAALGGLAGSAGEVIAARVAMGIGAAAVLPLSLTLVNDAFPPAARGRAMGIWAAISSLALAIGPLVGGSLAALDWRLIFWINVPIAVAGLLIISRAAAERADPDAGPVDRPGVVLLTAGLAAMTVGLIQAEDWGWDAPATLALLVGGPLLLAAFWAVEHRVSNPIVEFDLFRNRPYLGVSAAAFALVGAWWAVIFFVPQYLQDIRDYSAVQAGLLVLPITAPMVVLSPFMDRLVRGIGARAVLATGLVLGVAGLVVIGRIEGGIGIGPLLGGFLLFGLALGFVYAPMNSTAMEAMPRAKAGIAAGVLAMNRLLSGALTLALTGSIFHALLRERIRSEVREPRLGEGEAAELEGLANGTDAARERLAEQPADVAATIVSAVDEAFGFALANALWLPIVMLALAAIAVWQLVPPPTREAEPPQPGDRAGPAAELHHRFRFHH